MNYGITDSTGAALDLDPQAFVSAVRERWPGQVTREVLSPGGINLCTIEIEPANSDAFQIFLLGPETQVSTDGTDQQALEVAAWVRSLLPDEMPSEVWFFDEGFAGHAVLTPGITPDGIKLAWREHHS